MKIRSAYFEIIDSCNLNCSSCYNRSGIPHNLHEIPLVQFQMMVNRLKNEFGCHRITLSGGEPTLHSQFGEMLSWILSQNLEPAVVTNGTTMNQELIEAYNNTENMLLQVSLDGSCEKVNSRTRGLRNFEQTMKFLTELKCDDHPPRLRMVVSRLNFDDVGNFYDLAISMGCTPDFDFICRQGNADEIWETVALTAKEKLSVLRIVEQKNKEYSKDIQIPYCTFNCPLSDPSVELSVLIKVDGSLQPCQQLYDARYCIGNLMQDVTELIAMRFNDSIVQSVKKHKQTDYGCTKCVARAHCENGCFANAERYAQDPLSALGDCMFRKLQILGM